jgi:hypothetical protein
MAQKFLRELTSSHAYAVALYKNLEATQSSGTLCGATFSNCSGTRIHQAASSGAQQVCLGFAVNRQPQNPSISDPANEQRLITAPCYILHGESNS